MVHGLGPFCVGSAVGWLWAEGGRVECLRVLLQPPGRTVQGRQLKCRMECQSPRNQGEKKWRVCKPQNPSASVILRFPAHGAGDLNLHPGRLGREGRGLGRSRHLEMKAWAEFLPCPHLPTKPSNRLPRSDPGRFIFLVVAIEFENRQLFNPHKKER